jgi:hypothetical protein
MAVRSGLQKAKVDRLALPEPNIFINSDGYGAINIVTASLSSNIVTLILADNFYWFVGDQITVEGAGVPFNGTYTLTAANSATKTISYARTYDNVASTTPPAGAKVYRKEMLAYFTRYKIVSNQGESAWSGVHKVYADYWFRRPSGVTILTGIKESVVNTTSGKSVTISWDPVDLMIEDNFIRKPEYYDVWLQWYKGSDPAGSSGKWIYSERVQGTSMTFNVPTSYTYITSTGTEVVASGPNRLMIEVRLRGNPIIRQRQLTWNPDTYENTTYLLVYKTNTPVSV